MLGLILQESIELGIVAVKLIVKTASSVYRIFIPKQSHNLIEMNEIEHLKKRLEVLEQTIHLKDT